MTEKLKILEHHVRMIRSAISKGKIKESLPERLRWHAAMNFDSDDYKFTDKHPLDNYVAAAEKAAIAILDDNFEQIPDLKDANGSKVSFDIICFNCPNYNPEKEICRMDEVSKERYERYAETSEMSEEKKRKVYSGLFKMLESEHRRVENGHQIPLGI